jgi:hypothetical protein
MENSYEQLIDDYNNGILVEAGESLTDYIKRMGGVDYKAKGGIITALRLGLAEGSDEEPGFLKKVINVIPPNVRQFTYDVFGGDKPFTEKDLSEDYKDELKGIAEKVLSEGKGSIQYEDYKSGTMDKPLLLNLLSKNYNLKTLIGSGKVEVNEDGEIIVTDKFDFNNAKDINSLEDVKNAAIEIKDAFFSKGKNVQGGGGLYSALRAAAKYVGSKPGEGSDITINLGKRQEAADGGVANLLRVVNL